MRRPEHHDRSGGDDLLLLGDERGRPPVPSTVTIKRDATSPTISGSRVARREQRRLEQRPRHGRRSQLRRQPLRGRLVRARRHAQQRGRRPVADRQPQPTTPATRDTATVSGINIDLTAPGRHAGTARSTTAAATTSATSRRRRRCTATDDLSGPDGCAVTGYGTGRRHAHADGHGARQRRQHRTVATRTYTVLAWTLKGFYQPVDMSGVVEHRQGRLHGSAQVRGLRRRDRADRHRGREVAYVRPRSPATARARPTTSRCTATGGTSLRYDTTRRPVHLQLADAEEAGYLLPGHHDDAGRLDAHGLLQAEVTEVEVP